MDEFFTFALAVFVLIGFAALVIRVGAIQRGITNLEQQAVEQTRYLAAISANLATAVRARESGPDTK